MEKICRLGLEIRLEKLPACLAKVRTALRKMGTRADRMVALSYRTRHLSGQMEARLCRLNCPGTSRSCTKRRLSWARRRSGKKQTLALLNPRASNAKLPSKAKQPKVRENRSASQKAKLLTASVRCSIISYPESREMDEVDGKTLLESFMYGDAAGISN